MKRRSFVSASLIAAGSAAIAWLRWPAAAKRPHEDFERTADGRVVVRGAALAFDTSVSICVLHDDPAPAQRALARALQSIARLDARLTVQRPGSQVAELNAAGRLDRPDPHLVRALEFAQALAAASSGTFDPTVQPLWELHAACATRGRTPSRAELADACSRVGWAGIDVCTRRVAMASHAAVTLNGLLQGYAADVAYDELAQHGVTDALIDSGEYGALGSNAAHQRWRVGIQHPRDPRALAGIVRMDGRFLATSGDYATRFTEDFSSHHIFDPRTGESPGALSGVTVAAASGLLADGLTKPMMVLGLPEARRLLARFPGAGAVWFDKSGAIAATQNLAIEPA